MNDGHLLNLNTAQKEAVLHSLGPLLVFAGAGAGKTKTITHRILHLIKQGVAPKNILAITFTNKAAKEMRERITLAIEKELGQSLGYGERPFVSTFHALGVHIIKENARLLNIPRHFSIIDKADQLKIVKEIVKDLGFDPKEMEPGKILSFISREKGSLHSVADYEANLSDGNFTAFHGIVGQVWSKYEKQLTEDKALDFDDLLLKTYTVLRDHKAVLEHYQDLWTYIHIDEYQDTNKVQYMIAKLLAGKHQNLCVVGDIDQNIYSWRGADIKNILNFERDYPNAKTVLLEENYRSTQTILEVANSIIKKNKIRVEKNLFTKNAEGEKLVLFNAHNETEEAHFIAEQSKKLIEGGVNPKEIAVLYRANFQSRVLEEAFLSRSVPYQVLGTKFFERKEIKDIISFLRAGLNPESFGDIKRIINVPARGIGKVTVLKIFAGEKHTLPSATRQKVEDFYDLLKNIGEKIKTDKPSDVVKYIIKASGLEDDLRAGTDEDKERLENIRELATLAHKYDHEERGVGMEKMLEEAALHSDQDEMQKELDAVKLMTVHAAKGLEFDYVFITGLEDDLFPHQRMGTTRKAEDDEEERRLFYVALTRARLKIYLTWAETRTIYGSTQVNSPSEFIEDIEPDFLETDESFEHREKIIYLDL